ncbi:MAG: hypothetical protein M3Q65_11980 [Chloroflexota bacterium]|nr:hypothetical protein [Chloroflexota bacterium]
MVRYLGCSPVWLAGLGAASAACVVVALLAGVLLTRLLGDNAPSGTATAPANAAATTATATTQPAAGANPTATTRPAAGSNPTAPGTAAAGAASGTIVPGGPPVPVAADRPGQQAQLTFPGRAGQRISLGLTDVQSGGTVAILGPDGRQLETAYVSDAAHLAARLPAKGTYAVLVSPDGANTPRLTLTLSEDVAGAIEVGGPPVPVAIGRPGQQARFTFPGRAGQQVSLGLTGVQFRSTVAILGPDGRQVETAYVSDDDQLAARLPAEGTYAVLVSPDGAGTPRLTLTLSEDVAGTIEPGGPPVPVAAGRPGQQARLTFSGRAGQRVSLAMTDVQFRGTVAILGPDGRQVDVAYVSGASNRPPAAQLPAAGTYTIVVSPDGAGTPRLTLALSNAP